MRLKRTLELYGIDDIIESVRRRRRIVPEKVSCDLFDYLAHAPGSEKLFSGSYLYNYSWEKLHCRSFVNSAISRVGFVSRFRMLLQRILIPMKQLTVEIRL